MNAVYGLPHLRAELRSPSDAQACNVATNVPMSLVSTFYDLSDKMNNLQVEDPETFQNASKALHWLATGDAQTH